MIKKIQQKQRQRKNWKSKKEQKMIEAPQCGKPKGSSNEKKKM